MAANLSNLLGKLTSGQQTTIDYLAGMNQSGSVLTSVAASWAQYVATTTTPPSNPNVFTFGAGSVVTIGFYGTGSNAFTATEQTYAWQALSLWSSETGIRFKYASDTTKAQVNFVHASDTYGTVKKVADTGTYYSASTGVSTGTTGLERTTSGYINYDSSGSFGDITSYSIATGYGIDTLVHEAGHLIGLGHGGPYNGTIDPRTQQRSETDDTTWTIMSYVTPTGNTAPDPSDPTKKTSVAVTQAYQPAAPGPTTPGDADYGADWRSGNKKPYSPMALDIFAAQRLNGAPALSTFSGGQTFGFNSTINYTDWDGSTKKLAMFDFDQDTVPVLTLYDYGTKNTFDLSKYTTASTVNLNDGTFSSVAGLSDNIFIEYGTQIDHLVGGTGDDVITANERSDVIDGGGGANLVKFSGARSGYVLSYSGSTAILTKSSSGAAYSLTNIQQVQFGAAPAMALADLVRVQWNGPSGGHFGIAANWSDGKVPGSTSQVQIFSGANILVTQQEANEVDSLILAPGAKIDITSGRFVIDNAAAGSTNAGTIQVETGNTLYLAGGLTNIGTVALYGGILQTYSRTVSLSGGGTVLLQGGQIGGRDASGSPLAYDTFTNVDNTISGFGSIGRSGFLFPLQFLNAENANVVAADGTLTVSGAITNDGIMGASNNGVLDLSGAIDQTNGGRIIALGTNARVLLDGGSITGGGIYTVAGIIEVATDEVLTGVSLSGALKVDAGTKLTLVGDIYGDGTTIDATAGAISLTGARLHGITLKLPSNLDTNGLTLTDVGVSSPLSGSGLTLGGTVTNTSSIALVGDSPDGKTAILTVTGTLVLTGGGAIRLYDLHPGSTTESYSPNTQVITGDVSAVLDNEAGTITGYGKLGNGAIGLVNGPGGLIVATASTLFVTPGNAGLDNAGTIESAGGTLELRGTVRNTGGQLYNASGSFSLVDTAISGGTLSGAVFHTTGAVGLNTVTNSATLAIDPTVTVTLSGTIINANSLVLKGYSSNGWYSTVAIGGAVQLSGGGTVTMADTGNVASATQRITGTASDQFENVDNTISGYGVIGGSAMGFTNDAAGTVSASAARLTLDSGTPGLTNKGLMEAKSGGTLEISSSMANLGQVVARNTGTVILHKAVAYAGTIAAEDGGAIVLDGGAANGTTAFTMSAGSNLTVSSTGTIDGTVQVASLNGTTTVQPTATLTLAGTIANAGFMTLKGYSSNGWYSTLKVQGTAKLTGGGTVTLADTGNAASGSQIVTGTGSAADTLDNVSDVITGYGRIGAGSMKLINEYVIQAVGGLMLVDTGTNAVINTDLMTSATNGKAGMLEIVSAVANTGQIAAGVGGTTILHDAITGVGTVQVYDNGTLTLAGGRLGANQVVSSTARGTIVVSDTGALDGTANALQLAGTTTVGVHSTLTLSGTVANTGTLALTGYSSNGWYSTVIVSGSVVLAGGGAVTMADTGSAATGSQIVTGTTADMLDNRNELISGYGLLGSGTIGLVNETGGTIRATTGTLVVSAGVAGFVNAGRVEATTGTLELHGTVSGTVLGSGTIAAAGGTVNLVNTTLTGQSLVGSGAGSFHVLAPTALASASLAGKLSLDGNQTMTLSGTFRNAGTVALTGYSSNGWQAVAHASGAVSLTGGGTVTMADTANAAQVAYLDGAGAGVGTDVLTNVDNAITGYGRIGNATAGFVNAAGGSVRASGGTMTLNSGSAIIVNAGSMVAATGSLEVSTALRNTGVIDAQAGGMLLVHGVITNPGTIQAESGATLQLDGGTLLGGSITVASGANLLVSSASAIAASTPLAMAGSMTIAPTATLLLGGELHNTGAIALNGVSTNGWYATLSVAGTATLSGGGTLAMSDTGGASAASQVIAGGTLDNVDNTIRGRGTITAALVDEAGATLLATGQMTLNGAFTNAGTLRAEGGQASVAAATNLANGVLSGGTWSATNGTIALAAALTEDAATIVLHAGGAVTGNGTAIENSLARIDAGASLQLLDGRNYAGTKALANAGEIQLSGGTFAATSIANAGKIDGTGTITAAITGAGTIQAAGGTLTLAKQVSGALLVDAGSTLVVKGGAAAGTTLHFSGPGATIQIVPGAGAQPFNGRVVGSTVGDTIDLVGIAATGTNAGSTTTLGYAGTTIGTVTFDPGFVGSLASDGHGGTLITSASPDPLFDPTYYLATNPDVAAAGIDPYQHYMTTGWHEGRNPSALFNTSYYLNQNADVRAAGLNPMSHFEASGWREGRDPSVAFSVQGYLAAYPDVKAAGLNPLIHYLASGKAEGRQAVAATPHATGPQDPLVDAAYVYATNPAVAAAGLDASAWYHSTGRTQGVNPDALFDTNFYLTQNPDVKAAGIDPLAHFEANGWREGREPSLVFSDAKYLAAYPDVKAAGLDPAVHYVASGKAEGRMAFLQGGTAPVDPLVDVAYYDKQLGATLIPPGLAGAQQAAYAYDHGGWQAGLNPHALFDTNYYLSHNADVAAAHVDPLAHFEANGWREGRDPSAAFSTNKYLAAYADVKAAGIDPLLHYVASGQTEGRSAFAV